MAISVVGVGASNAGVGAVTYTLPSHQADDILVLVVECGESAGVTAPTQDGGWAHVTNSPRAQGSNVTCCNVMWKRATSGSMTNPQVPDPGNHQVGFVIGFRGVIDTGNPWDFSPVGNGAAGTTSISATGGTTTVNNCLVVIALVGNADFTTDTFASYSNGSLSNITEREEVFTDQGNGGGVAVITGEQSTAGATGTTTASSAPNSLTYSVLTFALKPATDTPNEGTGAGTFTFTGTAAGERDPEGTGAGTYTFTGTAAGKRTPKGSGTGSWAFTGAGAGKATHKGIGTGSWAFSGAAAGERDSEGTGAGTFDFTGAATGEAPGVDPAEGSGSGAWAFTGAATGARDSEGTGAGTFTFTGAAAGERDSEGTGAGTFGFSGAAAGARDSEGSGTGTFSFTGEAEGEAPGVGVSDGTGAGTWGFVGDAVGGRLSIGTAAGTFTFTGAATGETDLEGSGEGTWEFTGTAEGVATRTGSGEGEWGFVGEAVGTHPPEVEPTDVLLETRLALLTIDARVVLHADSSMELQGALSMRLRARILDDMRVLGL